MKTRFGKAALPGLLLASFIAPPVLFAQKQADPSTGRDPIIFAVLDGGRSIEPIAYLNKGKLSEVEAGAGSENNERFVNIYYRHGAKYDLVFGGQPAGTVAVRSSNIGTECGGSSASVATVSSSTKLSGNLMALASSPGASKTRFTRRRPTAPERSEIESLVTAEFAKRKVRAAPLRSLNLTGVDIDLDGSVEMIGSFWAVPVKNERALLWIIAEKDRTGRYALKHTELNRVASKDVMSGNVADLDSGVYHSLLLDIFDIDGDRVAEVFTISQAFEGNNYHVYKRVNRKRNRIFETYIYRCGY